MEGDFGAAFFRVEREAAARAAFFRLAVFVCGVERPAPPRFFDDAFCAPLAGDRLAVRFFVPDARFAVERLPVARLLDARFATVASYYGNPNHRPCSQQPA